MLLNATYCMLPFGVMIGHQNSKDYRVYMYFHLHTQIVSAHVCFIFLSLTKCAKVIVAFTHGNLIICTTWVKMHMTLYTLWKLLDSVYTVNVPFMAWNKNKCSNGVFLSLYLLTHKLYGQREQRKWIQYIYRAICAFVFEPLSQ